MDNSLLDFYNKTEILFFSLYFNGKTQQFLENPFSFKDLLIKKRDLLEKAQKIIDETLEKEIELIFFSTSSYPFFLSHIYNPPLVLFLKGKLKNNIDLLAVVGSRKATTYGREISRSFSCELAKRGIGIVSGMAFGIDGEAHRGALKADGYTLAVLAGGVDIPYPKSHRKLYLEILEKGGGIISEYPPGTEVRKEYFPQRNRIISGISKGVLVVEAARRSGSLITARYALEEGRDIFAVPGSIRNRTSEGTNQLIKSGEAFLITSFEDILEEWDLTSSQHSDKVSLNLTAEEKVILELIPWDFSGISAEEISLKTEKFSVREIILLLWDLSEKGVIKENNLQKYYRLK